MLRRLLVIVWLAACGGGGDQVVHVDRAHLADVGTSGRLDYADPALWLCRPGSDASECKANLDATEYLADGTTRVVPHVRAERPAFDCFYVYPTVSFSGGNVTNLADVSPMLDPLLAQAARFDRVCEVYAPLYRQVSLVLTTGLSGDVDLALQDVRDALQRYLEHDNHGRRFVLIGHSQGAALLARAIQLDVEGKPAVRARMISALLIGGEIRVGPATLPECGEILSAAECVTFRDLPLCGKPQDTGCVLAYSSYRQEAPPTASRGAFGRATASTKVACVNPRPAGGPYRGSYAPVAFVNPLFAPTNARLPAGLGTPFGLARGAFSGECIERESDGLTFNYLEISLVHAAGDQRPEAPYYSPLQEATGFGLHIADMNIPQDDLIDWVATQAGVR